MCLVKQRLLGTSLGQPLFLILLHFPSWVWPYFSIACFPSSRIHCYCGFVFLLEFGCVGFFCLFVCRFFRPGAFLEMCLEFDSVSFGHWVLKQNIFFLFAVLFIKLKHYNDLTIFHSNWCFDTINFINCCCENLWLRKEVLERYQWKHSGI